MSRLREEMKMIPRLAWVIAVCPSVIAALLLVRISETMGRPGLPGIAFAIAMAVFFTIYVLLVGYISVDARRRGMRPVLWTLLAIFIPNAIGIILYFILREPLLRPCFKCGASVQSSFPFCQACGVALAKTCPACKFSVQADWAHCPQCGVQLSTS
jgi:hypothetical protein